MVLASVGAPGWTQPQREVPALEAALVQLHAALQGQPPAAQASRSHAQHRVAMGGRSPRQGLPPETVKGRGGVGNRIEEFRGNLKKSRKEMYSKHTLEDKATRLREHSTISSLPLPPQSPHLLLERWQTMGHRLQRRH